MLLAHPEEGWHEPGASPEPAPVCMWYHGRTANKELDPGRYLRWTRAGIAACAIDLPGHGARANPPRAESHHTLSVVKEAATEIDSIIKALREDPRFNHAFDTDRIAIGGMSAGGMVTLHRLCSPHVFRCATVEATAGDFREMAGTPFDQPPLTAELNPATHLDGWRPIPLLSVHSESDQMVPFAAMRNFIETLREHAEEHGGDPNDITLQSWPETGAPYEHLGFAGKTNEAKQLQTDFLVKHLLSA